MEEHSRPSAFTETLERFPVASAELLNDRALLKRVDTKFILGHSAFQNVLDDIRNDYALLIAEGASSARYKTLYFDTKDFLCVREHNRGRRPRHKIRIRHYLDRKLTFLEVKKKTNTDRTVKARKQIAFRQEKLGTTELEFINEHNPIAANDLIPSLRTDFQRVTLLGLESMERVTFDLDLCFSKAANDANLPGVVIAEIKQDRFRSRSPVMLALRKGRVSPISISKYCTAATLLLPSIRMHRYSAKVRSLRKAYHD